VERPRPAASGGALAVAAARPPAAMLPQQALFGGDAQPFLLPVCDHYAGNERFLLKALAYQAQLGPVFDITADCEDGAPVGGEREHAQMIAAVISSPANRFGRVGIRIHDIGHPHWQKDLELILPTPGARVAYVTLPKVQGLATVEAMAARVNTYAPRGQRIPLHVLIETHGALREVGAIAAHPQVQCLSFGLMDFVAAHHGAIPASVLAGSGQFEHPLIRRAKVEIAAAAHAHLKVPSHNVSTALRDQRQVAADATRAAREFGYTRMWSVHPDQIVPILEAMQPRHDEVERAARILVAAADAQWGPIEDDGQLHDRASYRLFWTLLRRAAAGGVPIPEPARSRFFATA
jgi:citrate lyase subunit beta/citryl-CoA lyase